MPSISHKGQQMPASPIRKLVPFAEAAKQRGIHIYHLNIGQPDIKTPPQVFDALRAINFEVLEYSHSAGNESYRRKLVGYYAQNGISLTHNDILITTGGSEAILFGLMSCLDAGDEIIIPEPFYANYNGFSMAGDIVVKPITSYIENNFALPPIEAFEQAITPRTKAIMICNPNNPTGYLYSAAELAVLREIALKHDLFLFADEVYREFAYDGQVHTSLLTLADLDEHVIVIDSISKRYSACGARIGALITRNKTVLQTALKFAQARLSPPTFGQIAAESALSVPASYLENVIQEYQHRRNVLVEALNLIPGVYAPTPSGAFYVIARLPIDDADRFAQWLLEDFSFEQKTVMVAPATGFYATKGLGKNEVRIAYVLNETDLREAVRCLEKALGVYPYRIDH